MFSKDTTKPTMPSRWLARLLVITLSASAMTGCIAPLKSSARTESPYVKPGSRTREKEETRDVVVATVESVSPSIEVLLEERTECRTVRSRRRVQKRITEESLTKEGKTQQFWLGLLGGGSAVAGGIALAAGCNKTGEDGVERSCTADEASSRESAGYVALGVGGALLTNFVINVVRANMTEEEVVGADPLKKKGDWEECGTNVLPSETVAFALPDGEVVARRSSDDDGLLKMRLREIRASRQLAATPVLNVVYDGRTVTEIDIEGTSLHAKSKKLQRKHGRDAARAAKKAQRAEDERRASAARKLRRRQAKLRSRRVKDVAYLKELAAKKRETALLEKGRTMTYPFLALHKSVVFGRSVEPRPTIAYHEEGTITENGRALPAGIAQVSWDMYTSSKGEERFCVVLAAAYDEKFDRWRRITQWFCGDPDVTAEVERWKSGLNYEPRAMKGTFEPKRETCEWCPGDRNSGQILP